MSGAAGRPAGRRARSERSATVPGSSSLFAGALCAPAVPAPHCGPALHTPRLCARLSVSPALVYQPEHRRPGRPFQSQTLDDSRLDLVNVKCCFIIAADSDYFLIIFFFYVRSFFVRIEDPLGAARTIAAPLESFLGCRADGGGVQTMPVSWRGEPMGRRWPVGLPLAR